MSDKQLSFFKYDQNGQVTPKKENEFSIPETPKPTPPPIPDEEPSRKYNSYDEYIHSTDWKKKREYVIYLANFHCQICGKGKPLEVHHLHYDRLYREKITDLQALCKDCHPKADDIRIRIKRAENYQKGLNTYAIRTLKLGESWWYEHYNFAVYKFDLFLERKEHFDDGGTLEEWKMKLEYLKEPYFENYKYGKNQEDADEFNSYRDDNWNTTQGY